MLVLSRKVGESLQIGKFITVRITKIAGNRVTLGIDAPDDCYIVRDNVLPRCNTNPNDGTVYNCVDIGCPVHGERNRNHDYRDDHNIDLQDS